jgi:two-component system, OmpR family, response regulator ResD
MRAMGTQQEGTERQVPEFDQGRVLVVDDNEDIRHALGYLLQSFGFEAVEAEGGRAALEALKESEFDVVLMDVMMPDMDGLAVCREMRKTPETEPLPVILLTARDDLDCRIDAVTLGVADFLVKPVVTRELIPRLQTQVGASRRLRRLERLQKRLDGPDREETSKQAKPDPPAEHRS